MADPKPTLPLSETDPSASSLYQEPVPKVAGGVPARPTLPFVHDPLAAAEEMRVPAPPPIGHNMPPGEALPIERAATKADVQAGAKPLGPEEGAKHFARVPVRELNPYEDLGTGAVRRTAPAPYGKDVVVRRNKILAQFEAAENRAKKLGLPAPNIGKGSQAPLFDMSRIEEEWAPRAQFKLPRLLVPDTPKSRETVRMIEKRMNDPDNLARIKVLLKRGQELGGMVWYNTNPLRMAYMEELGTVKGQAAWERFMDYVAASSTRSEVPANIRNASYHQWLETVGRPPAAWWPPSAAEEAAGERSVNVLPAPYGHLAQRNQITNVQDIRGPTGTMDIHGNPKPPSFGENLKGNLAPSTLDAHFIRAMGLPSELEAPGAYYGTIEGLNEQNIAAPLGVTPGQAQASLWLGAAEKTGQRSGNEPFMGHMEDVVRKTAAVLGEDPRMTLQRFLRSNKPLLSIGLLTAATAYALAGDPSEAKASKMPGWARRAKKDWNDGGHAGNPVP